MKVLHINCNYFGHNPVHKCMIKSMNKMDGIDNYVFSPVTHSVTNDVSDKIVASNCINKWDRVSFYYKSGKIKKAVTSCMNIHDFDIVHAYTLFTDGNVAYYLKQKYNIPYVVAIRNTDINYFLKYRFYLRHRGLEIMENASAIFFLSNAYKEQVFNKYVPHNLHAELEKKVHIIPNGLDDFWLNNLYYDENNIKEKINLLNKKTLKLVYAGNIDNNKNLITTCKAIDLLKEEGWNVEYSVAGTIKNKKVYNYVTNYMNYKGVLTKDKLLPLYRESHIFIMPSFYESFGLVYAEAISQGLPIIYSKGQGFDGQFAEGVVGYSVNAIDPLDIKNKIIKIINQYKTISKNLSNKTNNYSWDDLSERYYEIYKNIT